MKNLIFGVAAVAALGMAVPPAQAEGAFCFRGYQVDHIEAPDDNTLAFHMKGGAVYLNHTVGRCPGLSLAADSTGFRLEGQKGDGEICSNLMWVELRESKAVCLLGAFELQK